MTVNAADTVFYVVLREWAYDNIDICRRMCPIISAVFLKICLMH